MICVNGERRRLLMLFTTPPERYVPIDPDDLEEVRAQQL